MWRVHSSKGVQRHVGMTGVRIHPRDEITWTNDYTEKIVRYIRWFRTLGADPVTQSRYREIEVDHKDLDEEIFELIQGLIVAGVIDGHIRIYLSSESKLYSWWLLPTKVHIAVWNNVERF